MDEDDIILTPFLERVPITPLPPLSERDRIHVAAMTAIAEAQLGADVRVTEEDEVLAQQMFSDGRMPTTRERTRSGMILKLDALLTEYDYVLIDDAARLRTYVTNRLIEESNDPDPKNRLRALELLGKMGTVGLFTERKEILITNRTSADLTGELRDTLTLLLDPADVRDVTDLDEYTSESSLPVPEYLDMGSVDSAIDAL
jgi:hypothetical protein